MAHTPIAHSKQTVSTNQLKRTMQRRAYSVEMLRGGRRRTIVVDLDVPLDNILKEVVFDTALLDPTIVREIFNNALTESKAGRLPRRWSFEFVGVRINDKHKKEFNTLQEISKDISDGCGVVDEVQSLESFLDPGSLSNVLSNALSNKRLQVLTLIEIIFFAYARKASGITAFMPNFPLERIIRYQKPNSPDIDVLKKMVPRIAFPLFFGKVKVKGHLLSGAELNVRMESNSYFIYKIDSSINLCQN